MWTSLNRWLYSFPVFCNKGRYETLLILRNIMIYIPGKWKNSYNSVSPHPRTSWGEGHSVNPPTFIGVRGVGITRKTAKLGDGKSPEGWGDPKLVWCFIENSFSHTISFLCAVLRVKPDTVMVPTITYENEFSCNDQRDELITKTEKIVWPQ